ncbi:MULTISPECIES: TlyA family RNA methyltransferase [Gulosibacter]|uniref:TlyA family RNA methyltransferase n=1 Tax=Gulosibacter TaxID=256818 RepID=UPI000F643F49|nr:MULTISPECIES: TlyA family RNA methyltransferase [Gulosibacter]
MTDRLDRALAARGLAKSRTEAARLVDAGLVFVDGIAATKASQQVGDAAILEVQREQRWVSRAAHKLLTALEAFGIDCAGREALDVGASTGGFTQVLLHHGAREVIALDVGHDQLDPLIRADTRVRVVEGENARYLTAERLEQLAPGVHPDLVVGDLSFISLRHVLPALRASVPAARDYVLLLKPQFEVGRGHVRGGLVTDPAVAADAALDVVRDAAGLELGLAGIAPSPITGMHGNHEYLLWLRADFVPEHDPIERIRRMVGEGGL